MGRDRGKGGRGCKSFGNPSGIELAERSREGGGGERVTNYLPAPGTVYLLQTKAFSSPKKCRILLTKC